MVKHLPVNGGDMGSIPGLGRSHMLYNNKAHVPQLLRSHTLEIVYTREDTSMTSLCIATKESPYAATKTQCKQN